MVVVLTVGILQLVGQPVETLVQTIAAGGASRLDVPVSVSQRVKTQFVGDFSGVHRVWQILRDKTTTTTTITHCTIIKSMDVTHLFVGENQQNGISEFVLGQHAHQLLPCLTDTLAIVAVDHEDQTLFGQKVQKI